ncbi:MAG: HEAT repeat domain-containing protein [Anaerolineae bacterium]|nr:HEAT repeat domain-containing protein [Anaerolineae bacterium]
MKSSASVQKAVLQQRIAEGEEILARCQEIASLAQGKLEDAIPRLVDFLGAGDPLVRREASEALALLAKRTQRHSHLGLRAPTIGCEELLALLQKNLQAKEAHRRAATADTLGLWGYEPAIPLLLEALQEQDPSVRASAATALGQMRALEATKPLLALLEDPSPWVRLAAAEALGQIGAEKATADLAKLLQDAHPAVRLKAALALGHSSTGKARRILENCALGPDPALRWAAAKGLATVGDAGSLPILEDLVDEQEAFFAQPTGQLAQRAIRAIRAKEEGFWGWLHRLLASIAHWLRKRRGISGDE